MELKEDEESAAAPAAEPSFLERFFGVRFDELVAAAQPQPAMQQLAEDLEDRLESLADLAESSASEGEEVTEQQPPLHAPPPPPPPWRDCRLSATDRQNFSSGCAACSVPGKGGMGNSPPSSSTSACASDPTMAAMSRSNVSEREQQAAASSSAATAATAASSAGAAAGSYETRADGERYFANGHLTSSMIGLSVRIVLSLSFHRSSLSCLLTSISQKRLCLSQLVSQVIHSRHRSGTPMLVAVSANGRGNMGTSEKEVARYLAHLFMIFTVRDHLAYFKYWQSNCNHTAWRCNLTASMKHNMFHVRCCLELRNA